MSLFDKIEDVMIVALQNALWIVSHLTFCGLFRTCS